MEKFKNQGIFLRTKREASKLTQKDLSLRLGLKCTQSISNIERGINGIPYKFLFNLSEILDIPKEEIKAAILIDFANDIEYHFSN